jgi:hypothetical protein
MPDLLASYVLRNLALASQLKQMLGRGGDKEANLHITAAKRSCKRLPFGPARPLRSVAFDAPIPERADLMAALPHLCESTSCTHTSRCLLIHIYIA